MLHEDDAELYYQSIESEQWLRPLCYHARPERAISRSGKGFDRMIHSLNERDERQYLGIFPGESSRLNKFGLISSGGACRAVSDPANGCMDGQ